MTIQESKEFKKLEKSTKDDEKTVNYRCLVMGIKGNEMVG